MRKTASQMADSVLAKCASTPITKTAVSPGVALAALLSRAGKGVGSVVKRHKDITPAIEDLMQQYPRTVRRAGSTPVDMVDKFRAGDPYREMMGFSSLAKSPGGKYYYSPTSTHGNVRRAIRGSTYGPVPPVLSDVVKEVNNLGRIPFRLFRPFS